MIKILFVFLLLYLTPQVFSCELKMGYRTSERQPFINTMPSNEGLYKKIFSLAANNIGCTLKIVRAPKKRILYMIEQGKIDFYPGLGESPDRSQFMYFWPNGLTSKVVAISKPEIPDILRLEEMEGRVLLLAHGANDFNAQEKGVVLRYAFDISLDKAIKIINADRADFYLFNHDSIKHYLATNPSTKIKMHPCCFSPEPMTLGFSKSSLNAKPVKHSDIVNLPNKPSLGTIAYKFKQEMTRLIDSKEIDKIKHNFYSRLASTE